MVADWRYGYGDPKVAAWNSPGVVFWIDNASRRATPMIPDRDIWRAGNLLIRDHGADAEVVAARRSDEMLERGDRDGQLVWLRIRRAIVELQTASVGKPN
jgi:hypothetical protein